MEVTEERGLVRVILAPGPGVMAVVSSWAGEAPGPGGLLQGVRAMRWPGQWLMDEFSAAYGRCPPALVTAA